MKKASKEPKKEKETASSKSKKELKKSKREEQDEKCALSDEYLQETVSLYDSDRIVPKVDGGIYTEENTRSVDPVAHMKRHMIHKKRTPDMEGLKNLLDERMQIRKLLNSLSNRTLAAMRETDQLSGPTGIWLDEKIKEVESKMSKADRDVAKYIKALNIPIVISALKVKGLGAITVAYLLVYVEIEKAEYASALWKYVGLDKPSYERYTKGQTGGGNKTLRTVLYSMAESMIKTRSPYRDVYDNEKQKLSNSLLVTKSRNTQGFLKDCMWKDTKPCHRHGAAIRKMIKHFLADFWFVYRTISKLPTPNLYVQDKMGHTGIVKPQERGWIF